MRSLKSVSGTTRLLSKALKREPKIRPIEETDMKWLWASYQMGVWNELFSENMARDEFRDKLWEIVSAVDFDWILEVQHEGGLRPVGIVFAEYRFGGHGVEPHVEWFPWATPRNKLECSIKFLKDVGKQYKVFLYIRDEDLRLWEHVWNYRVLKKACTISDCYGSGVKATMFYTPWSIQ